MSVKNKATIIFCDIVKFSKIKEENEQSRLIRSLSAEITHELHHFVTQTYEPPKFITIPTGDGLVVGLIELKGFNWTNTLFKLIERLMSWKQKNSIGIRIGVHYGAVTIVADIHRLPNIVGSTINDCQRVMDAANDNQVLFSHEAYIKYCDEQDQDWRLSALAGHKKIEFSETYSIVVKHGVLQDVHIMHVGKEQRAWWNDEDPISKDYMPIQVNPDSGSNIRRFHQQLMQAEEIAIIQLTGIDVQAYIMSDEFKLSDKLRKLWIFMPDPQNYPDEPNPPMPPFDKASLAHELWKQRIVEVAERYPHADVKLKLFKGAPYFCGSFIDWQKRKGIIYVNPMVWGLESGQSPIVQMQWKGKSPSMAYRTYCKGLDSLNEVARVVNE